MPVEVSGSSRSKDGGLTVDVLQRRVGHHDPVATERGLDVGRDKHVGAQGAILVYVALIVVYIVLMQFADARLQRALAALVVVKPEQ